MEFSSISILSPFIKEIALAIGLFVLFILCIGLIIGFLGGWFLSRKTVFYALRFKKKGQSAYILTPSRR